MCGARKQQAGALALLYRLPHDWYEPMRPADPLQFGATFRAELEPEAVRQLDCD